MKVGGRGGSHVSSSSKIFHLLNAGEKLVLASQSFLFPGRLPGSTLVGTHVPLTLRGLPVLAFFLSCH